MGNGTIMRVTRSLHARGQKHQASLRALVEKDIREREERIRRLEHESQQQLKRVKSDRLHLLMLSIVATRLRTQYESIVEARLAWLLDSQILLRRLDSPAVEAGIIEHTTNFIAATNILSVVQDSYVLVELISEHM